MPRKKKLKKFEIFKAKLDDTNEILAFIKEYWSDSHIFLKDENLFRWQHLQDDQLNFLIARNIINNSIDGILGYISTNQFDSNLIEDQHWGAIWKIKEGSPLGLGMLLLNSLNNMNSNCCYAAIGISGIAKGIYNLLDYKVGKLNHYYLINNKIENPIISKNLKSTKCGVDVPKCSIFEIDSLDGLVLQHDHKPSKTIPYLINRYAKHPTYKYRFLGISCNNTLLSIWVFRKQILLDSSCLRIVDMFGSVTDIDNLGIHIQGLLETENAEYIDCLNYGLSSDKFGEMGFREINVSEGQILPNYFEPYLEKNISVEFALSENIENYVIFKGDSDQDRPSLILSNEE